MAVVSEKFVCVLPPKTASAWVRASLNNAGIIWWQSGHEHGPPTVPLAHYPVFLTVRNPLTWLRSVWCAAQDGVIIYPQLGAGELPFDPWIRQVVTEHRGFAGRLFQGYEETVSSSPRVSLGKTEQIAYDLVGFLESVGLEFDREKLLSTPPLNVSTNVPVITEETERLVRASEPEAFGRYGYDSEGRNQDRQHGRHGGG
jgi:hypothetical protein